jgi:phosphonate metabolism protein (transferase hexapeptide repeat family)
MNGSLKVSEPRIDETARIQDSRIGRWTAVGARTVLTETTLGDYSYVANDCDLIYTEVGKFCSIASHVRINPGNHPLSRAALHHFTYRSRSYALAPEDDHEFFDWRRSHKVILENDVWVGHGAILLPGIRIGNGAAVGAGAVVTKDVPPFTIVAGVPARVIRRRVTRKVESALMRICWWDWPHERLTASIDDFRKLDAADFAAKYDSSKERRFNARHEAYTSVLQD